MMFIIDNDLIGLAQYTLASAGCYEDNVNSLKMVRKIGFVRYPNGDCIEKNCFTGEKTVQLEFRITHELVLLW